MRRQVLLLLLFILAIGAQAKSPEQAAIDNIFTEFSAKPEAVCVNIRPFMMSLCKRFMNNDECSDYIKRVKSLRILVLDECDSKIKSEFHKKIKKLNRSGFDEALRVNDNGDKVTIFTKVKDNKICRLLISCADNTDCVLIDITGKFNLSELDKIVESQTSKK